MPGLNTEIIEHRLPLKPECKPIQQKLRGIKPEMLFKIKEVKKQFDVDFLEVAKYPEWVANIVPDPKKDRKVRMCVDHRDLNQASPKYNFPLPHIDTLVDNTAKNSDKFIKYTFYAFLPLVFVMFSIFILFTYIMFLNFRYNKENEVKRCQ